MTQTLSVQQHTTLTKNIIRSDHVEMVTVDDFDTLFRTFQPKIISFIAKRVENREVAYDLTQDTFLKVYRALCSGTTVKRSVFTAWLYSIAKNTTTDSLRRKRYISFIQFSVVFPDENNGEKYLSNEAFTKIEAGNASTAFSCNSGVFENLVADQEIVEHILWERMNPKHSLCLWLYAYDGLSCIEIAAMLQISVSAVKMRLSRARNHFAKLYYSEMSSQ